MAVVTVSGAKRDLSDVLNRVAYGRERIIVESRGKPKAAVVPIEDDEALEELDELAGEELLFHSLRIARVPPRVRTPA